MTTLTVDTITALKHTYPPVLTAAQVASGNYLVEIKARLD